MKSLFHKYREQISYLFFGGVTTLVNIGVYGGLHTLLGVHSDLANKLASAFAVAEGYRRTRRWSSERGGRGRAMLRELGTFVGGRLLTGVMDQAIMHVAVEIVGPRLIPEGLRRIWDLGVKLASNVLVILLNYILSKKVIFRREEH